MAVNKSLGKAVRSGRSLRRQKAKNVSIFISIFSEDNVFKTLLEEFAFWA